MTTDNLPRLPEPVGWLAVWHGEHRSFWRSSRLMRDKANAEDIVRRWNSVITPRTKSYAVEAIYTTDQVEEIRRAAILAERERCAKVCDDIENAAWKDWKASYHTYDDGRSDGAGECAAAIREGGK